MGKYQVKTRYAVFIASAMAFSYCNLAAAQKLEGFDLSLAKVSPFPVTAFYETPENFSSLPVGSIIRQEPIEAPAGASAWRVLYVSERWDGTHVPASGLVIAPKQTDSTTPHPVVSWLHGTTGVARGCAPSLAPNPVQEFVQRGEYVIDIGIPYLQDWLAKGYAIVAPDYAGLGSDAVHRYLAGVDSARDVHNLLRAARSISEANIGKDVSLVGWSQGGAAALFAGEIAATYAPENKIRSLVALAPASTILRPDAAINAFFKAKVPYTLLVGQSYIDAYNLDKTLFTAEGQKLLKAAQSTCVVGVLGALAQSKDPAVTDNITDHKDWVEALKRNNAGSAKIDAPVSIFQGLDDTIVPPSDTQDYADRVKALGMDVSITWVAHAGHRDLFGRKKDEIVEKVVEGFKATSN